MTKFDLIDFMAPFDDEIELFVEELGQIFPTGIRYEVNPDGEGKLVFIAYPFPKVAKVKGEPK